jgi:hypothetical protein
VTWHPSHTRVRIQGNRELVAAATLLLALGLLTPLAIRSVAIAAKPATEQRPRILPAEVSVLRVCDPTVPVGLPVSFTSAPAWRLVPPDAPGRIHTKREHQRIAWLREALSTALSV